MKIKFEFGNKEIKITCDDFLKGQYRRENPFQCMLSKSQMELYYKWYEEFSKSMMNYYSNINKMYKEYTGYTGSKRTAAVDMAEDPGILPANGHDIYNYVARYGLANFQLQAVAKLDGNLDFEKLQKAVRLSIEDQPVFGCRFIENEPPYWKRLDSIEDDVLCSMEETDDPERAVGRFLDSSLDMDNDYMVKIRLIRTKTYDTLCIKVNHACCDGAGVKEYVQLLSHIYSVISQEHGIFTPNPAKRGRKEQDMLFDALGIKDPESEWIPGSEITRATWPFPWKKSQSTDTHMRICQILPEQMEKIVAHSKTKGVTVNDLILTAYYRAMLELGPSVFCEPMEISVTVDLRRYLPDNKTEAIRNFSGSEIAKVTLSPGEAFDETLSKVRTAMQDIKNARPGLQSAIGLERIEKLPFSETLAYYRMISEWPNYCSDKCAPVLSNLGIISKDVIKFGNVSAIEAYIVPPVVKAPGFLLMTSTYKGIMTLAAGFYDGSVRLEVVEKLLNRIKDELIEGCRQQQNNNFSQQEA